jgi:catechol 2,3-dioxygenase-like lactoylglutathione lyase family enzyme
MLIQRSIVAIAAILSSAPESKVDGVGAIGLTVRDAGRAARFYSEVLDFERGPERVLVKPDGRATVMKLGSETIELIEYVGPKGRLIPKDSRSNDLWFQHVAIVVSDMARAYARLKAHRVEAVSDGPQRLPDWNPKAGGIEAYYFRDPDAHVLEIIHFPKGKADPRWQVESTRLFLGIDHTAIAASDTDASVRFYRDMLGLRVAGESDNHGIEQERLNHVPGAHLRITTLRAAHGPGIELLEYLMPKDGRRYPEDTRANDLWNWQTHLLGRDVAPRLLRDPDGHALVFDAN